MIFQEADSDGNGTLSRMEFQEVSDHHVDPFVVRYQCQLPVLSRSLIGCRVARLKMS